MPHFIIDKTIEDIAKDIIDKHRPELGILSIAYMFRPEAPISDGKATAGMCVRVDDRNWAIHKHDFVIEIAKDIWDDAPNPDFRTAIVDHELGHCGIRMDESGDPMRDPNSNRIKTYSRKHSIEEFDEVMERYGTWHKSLRDFVAAYNENKKKAKGADLGDEE